MGNAWRLDGVRSDVTASLVFLTLLDGSESAVKNADHEMLKRTTSKLDRKPWDRKLSFNVAGSVQWKRNIVWQDFYKEAKKCDRDAVTSLRTSCMRHENDCVCTADSVRSRGVHVTLKETFLWCLGNLYGNVGPHHFFMHGLYARAMPLSWFGDTCGYLGVLHFISALVLVLQGLYRCWRYKSFFTPRPRSRCV